MATYTWTAATDGNWNTAANWSGGVPGLADAAFINLAGTYTVSSTATAAQGGTAADTLVLNSPTATYLIQGTSPAATDLALFTIGTQLTIQAGTLTLNNGWIADPATHSNATDTILNGGTISSSVVNTSSIVNNGLFENAGLVSISGGATLEVAGSFLNDSQVLINGGWFGVDGTVNGGNPGTITIENGGHFGTGGPVVGANTIAFGAGTGNNFSVEQAGTVAPIVTGFNANDYLWISGGDAAAIGTPTFNAATQQLTYTDSKGTWVFTLAGIAAGTTFTATKNATAPFNQGVDIKISGSAPPPTTKVTSDFNGDGKSDILWNNSADGTVQEWLMNGGTPIGGVPLLSDPAWKVAASGDFFGNGTSSILWSNATVGTVGWQMTNGAPTNAALLLGDATWSVAATGDFNGDGKADILWNQASTGTVVEWDMNGFAPISANVLLSDPTWSVVGTGHFHGGATSDILWRQASTGTVLEWTMNNGTPTAATPLLSDPTWNVAGVGDFNGDGSSDILWSQASTGTVVEWTMNSGTVTAANTVLVDPNWTVTGVGDYNGDGKADILWRNAGTGDNVQWLMNGATPTAANFLLNSAVWTPAHALLTSS